VPPYTTKNSSDIPIEAVSARRHETVCPEELFAVLVDKPVLATHAEWTSLRPNLLSLGVASAVGSIYDLKPRFQALLRPATRRLAARGVTANEVTIAAAVLSLATGALIATLRTTPAVLLVIPVVLLVRMALNAIDGMLAREHSMKSRLGAVLNELGDVTSDAGLYLPFALVDGVPGSLITAVVVLGIIGEMAGVVAVQIGSDRRYDGPFGKSDRAFAFGCFALLLGCGVSPGIWLDIVLAFMIALAVATIFNRSRRALIAGQSHTH
jgi:CDP-diacylglycerol--glycerol-3-phosphate 3-phosphatidyltransferase